MTTSETDAAPAPKIEPPNEQIDEEKRSLSHDEQPPSDPDVETAREGVEQHPPMTFKRFMAIFSLGCLLAAAQIPIYLLGGALRDTSLRKLLTPCRIHRR